MLTEVSPTFWAVRVNGRIVASNLPSQRLAEHTILSLPPEQQRVAEVVPMTSSGQQILLG
jgi:hypothetical protein